MAWILCSLDVSSIITMISIVYQDVSSFLKYPVLKKYMCVNWREERYELFMVSPYFVLRKYSGI